ncbi:MAG: heavy metal transporter [Flavobacteriaceae bacterium]|nr:heavy metal transporter [Flavobacteriaceae bacterium]
MEHSIEIQNLKCGGCANTIVNSLEKIPSISNVQVDVENATVRFTAETDSDRISAETKLATLGYPPVGAENPVLAKTKSFISCATGRFSR